jgi:hypothetical protein
LFQGDDSPSNSIVVHCGDDSNSAEEQGLNAGEERPLPPVSSCPVTAKVIPLFTYPSMIMNLSLSCIVTYIEKYKIKYLNL